MSHCWSLPTSTYREPVFINDAESSSTLRNTPPTVIDGGVRKDAKNLSVIEGGIQEGLKYYCLRSVIRLTECLNANVLDCSMTFSVDKDIYVLGVQVPTQMTEVVS